MYKRQLLSLSAEQSRSPDEISTLIAEKYSDITADDLLTDIALGNRLPQMVASTLLGRSEEALEQSDSALSIRGTEGYVLVYAKCCCPLPGDPIEGFLSPDRGLVVHRENCRNLNDLREQPERLMPLRWDDDIDETYPVAIRIEMANQRGMICLLYTSDAADE